MFSGNFSNQGQTMQPTGMQGQQPMGTSALFSNPQPNMVSILQKFIFRIKKYLAKISNRVCNQVVKDNLIQVGYQEAL